MPLWLALRLDKGRKRCYFYGSFLFGFPWFTSQTPFGYDFWMQDQYFFYQCLTKKVFKKLLA